MNDRPEITIKFGRGLMEEPFISKKGTELVQIKIPNEDSRDNRPWRSFVVPVNFVHDNQFGKGVWMKLPENGTTRVTRSEMVGQDEFGKNIWQNETVDMPNVELKAAMEAYKNKNKSSVLADLSDMRAGSAYYGSTTRGSGGRHNVER